MQDNKSKNQPKPKVSKEDKELSPEEKERLKKMLAKKEDYYL
jgi:hypothetical protein